MNRKLLEQLKAFGMTNQLVVDDLTRIGVTYSLDLGHIPKETPTADRDYYPQIDSSVRNEAALMSKYYEVFYSLEKTIRTLVSDTIREASNNDDWWDTPRVPDKVKQDVAERIQKEKDSGMTLRSEAELDFTTFGELSVIINANWDIFGALFSSKKAVEKVMSNLNTLRGPIAHCTLLAEDERVRLQLTVRDWFRLME